MTSITWPSPFPPAVPRFEDRHLLESMQARRMALQQCGNCGHVRYPAAERCPECLSAETQWVAVSGKATLLSWCTFHRRYLEAFPPPHTVAVARLAEGPLFVAMLLDGHPPDGASGADLEIVYVKDSEGHVLPAFRTCGASA